MTCNGYPDKYEYDRETLLKITYALDAHYPNHNVKVGWYKQNADRNCKQKIDAVLDISLIDISEIINLQVKKANYPDSFSVSGSAMRDYLTGRHDLQGLLVYLIFSAGERLYLFDWVKFIEYAQEVSTMWYVTNHDYYIVPVTELIETLGDIYYEEILI